MEVLMGFVVLVLAIGIMVLFIMDKDPTTMELIELVKMRYNRWAKTRTVDSLGLNQICYGKCSYCEKTIYVGITHSDLPLPDNSSFRRSHIMSRHIVPFLAHHAVEYMSTLTFDKPGEYYLIINGKTVYNFADFLRVVPENEFRNFVSVQRLTGRLLPSDKVRIANWMFGLMTYKSMEEQLESLNRLRREVYYLGRNV